MPIITINVDTFSKQAIIVVYYYSIIIVIYYIFFALAFMSFNVI